MAVEKGKVMAVLNKRLQGRSVSKNLKEKLAARYAEKIEADDDIDDYVGERIDDILDMASEGDRRVSEATKPKPEPKPKNEETEEEETSNDAPDTPKYVKLLMKQLNDMKGELASIKAEKTAETLADRFKKDERLKGIPEAFFKGRIPTKDEDFEAAVTELVADYAPLAEQFKLGGFGKDAPPANPAPANPAAGKVDPDIVSFGKAKSEAAKSANA